MARPLYRRARGGGRITEANRGRDKTLRRGNGHPQRPRPPKSRGRSRAAARTRNQHADQAVEPAGAASPIHTPGVERRRTPPPAVPLLEDYRARRPERRLTARKSWAFV